MKYYIGIDPGVSTGIAFWDPEKSNYALIRTVNILDAMEFVLKAHEAGEIIEVVVEDARLVKYRTDPRKAQGAGSIKRDCGIWETFLKQYGIPHTFVRPRKAITKIDAKLFKMMTKYDKQTSNHARDAAMLVFERELR